MVFGCFRSVLNSQHGDVNGFFNGFQASKSWNAGRYLNQRRTGWWHQCRHVDGSAWRYPSAIGWVGWLNSMSWESVSVTHLDVPGFSCGKVHILSGANDPSKNAVLIVKFWWLTLKSWNIQSNTVDFHTQTADLLCGCFSNLERPAYYSRWHLFFFFCVCVFVVESSMPPVPRGTARRIKHWRTELGHLGPATCRWRFNNGHCSISLGHLCMNTS